MSEKSWLERATEAGPIHFREVCLQAVTAYSEEMVDIFNRGSSEDLVFFVTAMRLLERGLNVALISAYRFVEAARQAVFERQGDALDSLMGCDVLLMDDLGSEPVIDNITHVHLYNLVNERLNGGKATVLSTNLSVRELKEHNTERIASRLTDKHSGLVLELRGQDIRRL